MPKLILTARPAEFSGGFMSVRFDGKPAPFPPRTVDIRTTADALRELETYKADAATTGLPLAVSMRIADGDRAPNGFKAATAKYYHAVNG